MNLAKKARLLLIIIIGLGILLIGACVLMIVYITQWYAAIFGIVAVIALLVVYRIRESYLVVMLERKQELLIASKIPAYTIDKLILNDSWRQQLLNEHHYTSFISHEEYSILYKLTSNLANNKDQTLMIVVVITDDKVRFEDLQLAKDLGRLEHKIPKKQKYKNRIIMQFKAGNVNDDQLVASANKVFFFLQARMNFVLINCIFQKDNRQLYFLHSKDYTPTAYYQYGVNEIKRLT
jgi:hypothetical protein